MVSQNFFVRATRHSLKTDLVMVPAQQFCTQSNQTRHHDKLSTSTSILGSLEGTFFNNLGHGMQQHDLSSSKNKGKLAPLQHNGHDSLLLSFPL
jgi:hypothetical protein